MRAYMLVARLWDHVTKVRGRASGTKIVISILLKYG